MSRKEDEEGLVWTSAGVDSGGDINLTSASLHKMCERNMQISAHKLRLDSAFDERLCNRRRCPIIFLLLFLSRPPVLDCLLRFCVRRRLVAIICIAWLHSSHLIFSLCSSCKLSASSRYASSLVRFFFLSLGSLRCTRCSRARPDDERRNEQAKKGIKLIYYRNASTHSCTHQALAEQQNAIEFSANYFSAPRFRIAGFGHL